MCGEVGRLGPNYSQGVVLKNILCDKYIMFPKHIHTSYMTQFIGVLLCFHFFSFYNSVEVSVFPSSIGFYSRNVVVTRYDYIEPHIKYPCIVFH